PVMARNAIVVPAVGLVVEIEELRRQGLRDRHVEHAARGKGIEPAVTDFELAAQLAGRRGPGDIDDAADGIAAEEGALRTAQHFDFGNIEEVQELPGAGSEKYPIDDHCYRRIE